VAFFPTGRRVSRRTALSVAIAPLIAGLLVQQPLAGGTDRQRTAKVGPAIYSTFSSSRFSSSMIAEPLRSPGWLRASCGLLALLALLLPSPAAAHTALTGASPANGAQLAEAPRELRLRFNEPIESALARVVLIGPDGSEIRLGGLRSAADSAGILIAPVDGLLSPGEYTVQWQVAGSDGHPVRGVYTFVIMPGAAGIAPDPSETAPVAETPPAEPHHDPTAFPTGAVFDASSPLFAAVRWLTFVGLLGAIGAVAFRLVVVPSAARRSGSAVAPLLDDANRRAARIGVWMAGTLGVAAILRLGAQSAALLGPERVSDTELLGTLLLGTTWGWGWLLQAIGVLVAMVGFAYGRRGQRAGWALAAIAVLALAFTPGLSGHAVSSGELAPLAVLADGLHVLGAGGWLGSLLVLVIVGIPAAMGLAKEGRGPAVAGLVRAYSPTALLFAGVIVATGIFATWLHVGSWPALWQSGYGRTLLLKLAFLTAVFSIGAYNWRRLKPTLGGEAATGKLRRSATVELALGALVLAVTATLVATSPPVDTSMAALPDTEPVATAESAP
jgi:putative copper export protein/methionine-rich copper-binding protein CopC